MSSVASIFRRVVRGEWAGGCVLLAVLMMGIGRLDCGPRMVKTGSFSFSSDESGADGPLGDDVRDRRSAGEDREAALAKAVVRCGLCNCIVSMERRVVRLACDSTRWNRFLSTGLACPLSESESSQAPSSSSIALSDASPSSSSQLSIASSSSISASSIRLDWTISLNEGFLDLSRGLALRLFDNELCFG